MNRKEFIKEVVKNFPTTDYIVPCFNEETERMYMIDVESNVVSKVIYIGAVVDMVANTEVTPFDVVQLISLTSINELKGE